MCCQYGTDCIKHKMHKYILFLCIVISAIVIDNFVSFKTSVNCQCKPEESLFTCTCKENTFYLSRNNSHELTVSNKTILIPNHVPLFKIQVIKVHGVHLNILSNIFPKSLLNNLIQFHVKGCNVEIIDPEAFQQISDIQELIVRGNILQTLSSNTFQLLKKLTRLILTNNLIQQIPEGLFDNSLHLTEIYLDRNNISALPDGIFDKLVDLQSLHLEHNTIKSLNNNLFINNLKLKELKISFNKIENLPPDLFKYTANIVQIHINDNNIQTIPSKIFSNLKTLNVISMQNNSINQLKSAFHKNDELSSINLNNNGLSFVPENVLEESRKLKYLNIENNHLICNCTMKPFYKETKKRQIIVIGSCEEPMEYRNFLFHLLPDIVFACPPKIQDFTHKENENMIEFECVIQSDLTPNITFYHQGNLIPEGNLKINSISTTYLTKMLILNSTDDNRGDYKCFVSNEKGEDEAKLFLINRLTTEIYETEEYWDSREFNEKVSALPPTPSDSNNSTVTNKCNNKKEYLCELHNKNVQTVIWSFKLQNISISHIIIKLVRNTNSVTSSLIVDGQMSEISCKLTDDHNEIRNKTWNNNTAIEVSDTNFVELKFYIQANDPVLTYEHQRLNINCTKSCASCENCESETSSDEYLNNLTYNCEVRHISQMASMDLFTIFWISFVILLLVLLILFFIIKTFRKKSKLTVESTNADVLPEEHENEESALENLFLKVMRPSSNVDAIELSSESEECQPLMLCSENLHSNDTDKNEKRMSDNAILSCAKEDNNIFRKSEPIVIPIPPNDEIDLILSDISTSSEDIHFDVTHLFNGQDLEAVQQRSSIIMEDTTDSQVTGTETNGHQSKNLEDLQSDANQCNSNDNNEVIVNEPLNEIISYFDDLCQALNDAEYPETINEVGEKQPELPVTENIQNQPTKDEKVKENEESTLQNISTITGELNGSNQVIIFSPSKNETVYKQSTSDVQGYREHSQRSMAFKKIECESEDKNKLYSDENQIIDSKKNYQEDKIADWQSGSDQSNLSNTNTFVSGHNIVTKVETQTTDRKVFEAQQSTSTSSAADYRERNTINVSQGTQNFSYASTVQNYYQSHSESSVENFSSTDSLKLTK